MAETLQTTNCTPRLVVVGSRILSIQERLTTIKKRLEKLDSEYEQLETEVTSKLSDLATLQREMDKLTATHHVVQE